MSWTPCSLDSPTVSVEVYRADQASIPARLTDGRIGSRIIAIAVGRMLSLEVLAARLAKLRFMLSSIFRSYALTRGAQERNDLPPLSLIRRRGMLLVQLPTGSEPGK
jgi:hypothetical protein